MMVKSENETGSTTDREIVISRVYEASAELVWQVWTNPNHLSNWWGPVGFSTTIEVMDVRPGGVWKHTMHGPDGRNYPNECVFEEVQKPNRIVYSNRGKLEDSRKVSFRSCWTFEEIQLGRTRVTIHMVFPTADERDLVVRDFGAIEGGNQTLTRLGEHISTESGSSDALIISRIYQAPRERVFQAWTTPDQIMKWWGPKCFTSPRCKVDFQIGGTFLFCMRSPDGKEAWSTGTYLDIRIPEKIVSNMYFADPEGKIVPPSYYGLPAGVPQEVLDTVRFEVVGENQTKLTLQRKSIPAVHSDFKAMMDEGWKQSFEKLAVALGGISSDS